jgi:hypothetical protein
MSVDIQKQIRDNANDASAFFKDLYEWTEDMNLAEKRRGGGGTAKSFVPPPRGKVEEEPKKKTAVKEQSGTAKKLGGAVSEIKTVTCWTGPELVISSKKIPEVSYIVPKS